LEEQQEKPGQDAAAEGKGAGDEPMEIEQVCLKPSFI